jgi:phenylalanine-4-hydroxylase
VGENDLVALDQNHPGFRDPVYRTRRNSIARIALDYRTGDPIPDVAYTEDEHSVWRLVSEKLADLHNRYACREYLQSEKRIALGRRHIPQLSKVSRLLLPVTGFKMVPVAGLVSSRVFLSHLAQGTFLSTQYIRHGSQPLYTPEPDIVHELIGHACSLSCPAIAALNRLFGEAAPGMDDAALVEMERVYWYTMEFGVLFQDGALKAYGAGLLSSFGELDRFEAAADIRPFDPDECMRRPYDPTTYQAVLYEIPDFPALETTLKAWIATRVKT